MQTRWRFWLAQTAILVLLADVGRKAVADEGAVACLVRGTALVAALSSGDTARAGVDFDATLKDALPPATLAAVWVSTLARFGELRAAGTAVAAAGNEAAPYLAVVPLRFDKAMLNAVVACDPAGKVAGFHLVPRPDSVAAVPGNPSDGEGYTSETTTIGADGLKLGATVYRPAGRDLATPSPAVLLLAGSGPQDRDSTIGAAKPLRDLAVGLAGQGMVVMAYDKRTHARPGLPVSTVDEEVTDDAVDAIRRLSALPGVDASRVFVLGHSWGGTLAPRVAQRAGGVTGLILLAAGLETLDEAYGRQLRFLAHQDGRVDASEQAQLKNAEAEMRRLADLRQGRPVQGRLPLGIPASYWQSLAGYDPVAVARSLDIPVLALWAGRDYQVLAEPVRDQWIQGISPRRLTVEIYPTLGHTFMPMSDPPVPARLLESGQVDPGVIRQVATWIHQIEARNSELALDRIR